MVISPIVQWLEQSLSIDPSGSRHLLSPGAGFIKLLGTGTGQSLNFGSINTTGSGAITDTKLIYARVNDFGDASGVYGMRVYWHNISAFTAGVYRFLEQRSLHFIPNLTLNSSANNLPTIVPTTVNFSGTIAPGWSLGSPWMSGTLDEDVSMYLYLAVEAGVDVPIGLKGGDGAGTFRGRLIYDFS